MDIHSSFDVDDATTTRNGSDSARADIVRLLCAYVSESLRVTEQWASAHGVHHTDLRAMAALGEATRGGTAMTAGRLSVALGLSSPATTALISRLESAGHLKRTRDPEDRRRVLVTPSSSALRGAVEYFEPLGEAVTTALADFNEEERQVIATFLQALVERTGVIPQAREVPEPQCGSCEGEAGV